MFKRIAHSFITTMVFTAAFMGASASQASAEQKVAALDMNKVINESIPGKAAIRELTAKRDRETEILKQRSKEYEAELKNFQLKQGVARPEVLEERERDLLKKKRDIEAYSQDVRRAFMRSRKRMEDKIIGEVEKVVNEYAKKIGYSMVFTKSEMPGGGVVVYVDDAYDITDAIIKLYDEKAGQ